MTAYDRAFLQRQGYFEQEERDVEVVEGREIAFVVDPSARLAYVEAVPAECHRDVVTELRSTGRSVDVCWFWNPGDERVAVHHRFADHEWFVYDQSVGLADETRRRAERRLESIDEGLQTLFDGRPVADRFYRNLWDLRLALARSFDAPDGAELGDRERLMAAQRTVDRLVFCYFLVETDVVHGVDDAGDRVGLDPGTLFASVLEEGDFDAFLAETFFTHLTCEGWTGHRVGEDLSITYPYLGGGLFRDHEVPTEDGGTVQESELDASSYDWEALVAELNRYDWVVEASPSGQVDASVNRLSPAVLGHVFEKFVVAVSELSDDEGVSLAELDEMEVSATSEQLLAGNRKVGAYYTPDYIAYENTRETLWNRVRTVLADEHGVDRDAVPSPDAFFERATGEAHSLPVGREDLEEVLSGLTVLDPSVGSGAFLLTAGEILETWRRQCAEDVSRDEVRRDIVRRSLHGVDLLDGAVEVCRLRLWLWLLGATTVDLDAAEPTVEPLPSLDFTVRQGNGLVGLAEQPCEESLEQVVVDWTDGERRRYPEAVSDYRANVDAHQAASGPAASDLRETVETQRAILQRVSTALYARESDVAVEEEVTSCEGFRRVLDGVDGPVRCTLDFDSPMTDAERRRVADAGFREQRNWPTTASHADVGQAAPSTVEALFDLMADRGTVTVERPVDPSDVAALDPFHWLVEFPTAYAPTGGRNRAFDVVIGNPPHGSTPSDLETSLLEEEYTLVDGGHEAAKLFVERGWTLTADELSYVVPKASTYNSNWEDFRAFCLPKLHRGLDLGKAFRDVDHEQVTVHLSRTADGPSYRCGPLPEGAYHLDDAAEVERTFADRLGTLPVSFTSRHQRVAEGLAGVDFPTLGDEGVDAGRGASTRNRIEDPAAPIGFNGKQVQRYFTRPATDHVDVDGLSAATAERLEAPKVIAQNIIAHVQNPYDHLVVAAAYDPVPSYTFETVTNILLPEDSRWSLPALATLLNTQFVNWFVNVSIFNRAIRDMHLDRYFLERVVLPADVSDVQREVLETLYGLLAVTQVAAEHDALPDGREAYDELQNVTNALTYELYLADVDEHPLRTDLAGAVEDVLDGFALGYEEWYGSHLRSADVDEVVAAFDEDLFETAGAVAEALVCEETTEYMRAIADHPWVEVIERGEHRPAEGGRPCFGPDGGTE